ncbi:MAG: Fic family protein [Eubacteriales bacterium]|nr:Fic family protein [Eubacteriales bacterium]
MYNEKAIKILARLQTDFENQDKTGLYGLTQYKMAYHSNHMEGSTLTEDQTAFLFDTESIGGDGEVFRSKDIEEAQGHFLMFNHMLKTMAEPLSERLVKEYHKCLKAGVFEDRANGYAIGVYKTRANRVGNIQTALPGEVPGKMQALISEYNQIGSVDYCVLARFHAEYECIHPFQDGNGRTGRMILFRECLKNGLIPIIIRDHNSVKYKLELGKAQKTGNMQPLVSLFESEAKWYESQAESFL